MALTISTGFVVDDAIVMIENIARYIEEGEQPFEAALKGAKQIGFTIVSLTVSLVAVLIPLLFMGGAHRPAVPRVRGHARDRDRRLGGAVADADRDDVRAHPASRTREEQPSAHRARVRARLRRRSRGSTTARSRWVLRHQRIDAARHARDGRAHRRCSRSSCPKGFFPQQDTGLHHRRHRGGARRLVRAHDGAAAARVADVLLQRSRRRDAWPRSSAPTAPTRRSNSGPLLDRAQAARRARRRAPPRSSTRLQPRARAGRRASRVYLQPVQDLQIDSARQPHAVPVHARGRRSRRARGVGAAAARARCAQLPELRDVASDQQDGGPRAARSTSIATPRRASASRRRRSTTRSTTRSASARSRRSSPSSTCTASSSRSRPSSQQNPDALDADLRALGDAATPVPLSAFAQLRARRTRRSSIAHQGQFPAVTLSFNLAPGVVARRRGRRDRRAPSASSALPPGVHADVPGRGAGVPRVARDASRS